MFHRIRYRFSEHLKLKKIRFKRKETMQVETSRKSEDVQTSVKNEREERALEFQPFSPSKTPKNLTVRNLVNPVSGSQIVLLGIEKRNLTHASYLCDFLDTAKPDSVFLQMPPDLPYFIRTNDGFMTAWRKFVKGQYDYKFYVNSSPSSIYDILLSPENIRSLMQGSFLNETDFFDMRGNFIFTHNPSTKEFEVETMLSLLAFAFNNSDQKFPIYVGDLPVLIHRQYIAEKIELPELKRLYENFFEEKVKGNKHFEVTYLRPDLFIRPKLDYISRVLQNISFAKEQKILAVCDVDTSNLMEEYWQQISPQRFKNFQKIESALNFKKNYTQSFIEFIEKHVILDIIADPVLRKFFTELQTFPLRFEHTIGGTAMVFQLFIIYEHYFRLHMKGELEDKRDARSNLEELGKETTHNPSGTLFN